jgi:hypothetical protein
MAVSTPNRRGKPPAVGSTPAGESAAVQERLNGSVVPVPGQVSPLPGRFTKGYRMRGLWMTDRYTKLRNAAWVVRNQRVGNVTNPASVLLVEHEVLVMLSEGEDTLDVVEALVECLLHDH